jgi:tyrosine-protein phosphatase YwqE
MELKTVKHYLNGIFDPLHQFHSIQSLLDIISPSKKEGPLSIGASLQVDLHAHWLPGVDDGAKTVKDGLEMVRGLSELGFKKLIATPHIMVDHYANTPGQLRQVFRRFKKKVRKAGIPVDLALGAEYMLDDGFRQHLEAGDLLTIHQNLVLVEMSCLRPAPKLSEYLFQMQLQQYQPVLAHPERYGYYHKNMEAYEELKNAGVLFQVNLLSLTGYYGRSVAEMAKKLLARGWVEFAGTDVHHLKQINKLTSKQVTAAAQAQNPVLR